ncbi:MAG: hypothetical protein Q8L86_10270 [Vicinamibacterales bacterium]|nr:hypothetical protein [Vicinamibacterales bacterium]
MPPLRRSRKRSATSTPPSAVRLLIDECLGRVAVPEALRQAGASVVLHSQLFAPGLDDVDWLRQLANHPDLVVLSKDKRIRKRTIELEAVMAGRVRLFVLTAGKLNGAEQAESFVRALTRILRLARRPGPFIATVTAGGHVTITFDGGHGTRRHR